MEYYGNNDYRDYLALRHHGILGQRWGHRNGPPYPLGSGDHSASEKKAGWRKSLGGGIGEAIRIHKRAKKDGVSANEAARRIKEEREKSAKEVGKKADNTKIDEPVVPQAFNFDSGKKSYEDELKEEMASKKKKRRLAEGLIDDFAEYGPREFTKEEKEALDEIGIDLGYKIRNGEASKKDKVLYKDLGEVEAARDDFVKGKKVGNTSAKSPKENWSLGYSSEDIKTKMSQARNKGQFSVDFLEAVQNKDIANKYDSESTAKLLKEYEKYLRNPENYWKKERYKLKEYDG